MQLASAKKDYLLMNILGLIPARGGSKSIPRKNIVPLVGRPLLAYTCDASLESRKLDRIIISTDDDEIATVARDLGIEVPFIRPQELAQDRTPSLDVAKHALQWLLNEDKWQTDILVLLQPTSPLRKAHHIDEAVEKLLESGADTIVSVIEVPHRFSPYNLMRLDSGKLSNFWCEELSFDPYHRQSIPVLYTRNGPAILACKSNVLSDYSSFYGPHIIPYNMTVEESVDIDDRFDLQVAEMLLKRIGQSA